MITMLVGLLLFIGMHSVRIVADSTRTQFIENHSDGAWKGLYSLVSLVGLVLIVYGYQQTRLDPILLWHPPLALRHLAILLMLFAFVLLVATYVPGNAIKAKLGHPMLLGIKLWAVAHLLVNGRLGDVVLFGVFLLWAVADFIYWRRRDRAAAAQMTGTLTRTSVATTVITVVLGVAAFAVFAMWLHVRLIGVGVIG